jgi:hypothetical protein
MTQAILFAYGGRSHEYHHGIDDGVNVTARCGQGARPLKGAPTWATKDDVPTRLEECPACAKAATTADHPVDGDTAEPAGTCRTCSLNIARFPDGLRHEQADGTFTVKGRGGCKGPAVFPGERKPLPRLEPDPPAGKLSDALALRHEVEGPGFRLLPPVPLSQQPSTAKAEVEAYQRGVRERDREVAQANDGVAQPFQQPWQPVVVHVAPVGEPDWYIAMVDKGCDMLRQELRSGDGDEAVRTAEVLLFIAQRARDKQASKKPPAK